MDLDNRKKMILSVIVEEHIRTGEPVGSKTVAEKIDNAFSSATLRNEMAALTQMGLLEQPHASAGRIPSYQGYQYYIRSLMPEKEVPEKTKLEIQDFFKNSTQQNLGAFVEQAAEALAYFTKYTSVSVTPKSLLKVFAQVEILPTQSTMVIVLLATTNGEIRHTLIRMPFSGRGGQYVELAYKINKKLGRVPLDLLTAELFEDLGEEYRPIYQSIEKMAGACVGGEVIISGENRLFAFREFTENPEEMLEILRGEYLRALLDGAGIYYPAQVVRNVKNTDDPPEPVGIVAAKYHVNNQMLGTIGIVGPARMNYSEMVPYVYYFAGEMGKVLEESLWSGANTARLDGKTEEFYKTDM